MAKEHGKLILDEEANGNGKLIIDSPDGGKLAVDEGGKLAVDETTSRVNLDKYVSGYPLDYYEIGTAYVFPKLPFPGTGTKFATNPNFEEASEDVKKKYAKVFPKMNDYYARLEDGITQTIGIVIEKIPGESMGMIKVLLANGTTVKYATDYRPGAIYDAQDPLKLPQGLTYADNK